MNQELIKDVAGYIATSSEIISGLVEKTASLETQLRDAKAELAAKPAPAAEPQQKTAAEVLDPKQVADTVGKMIQAGMFKDANRTQIEEGIRQDPSALLRCLDKVADEKIRATVVPIGEPVNKPTRNTNTAGTRKSDEVYESHFQ